MKILMLIVSLIISFSAGAIGSLATISNIPTWYALLDKPPFLPPNNVFGPVWSLLYTLIGVALFLVWNSSAKKSGKSKKTSKKSAYIAFGVQLVLNTLWSLIFFGLHQTWLAAAIIVLLIGTIIYTIKLFSVFSKPAAWLLVPYLAWVCFATYLNLGVAVLN